ncbi:hypothetical protein BDZ89DRAFT_1145272 [Hymenopellis radicata]|nr:hypothetical protein BDZ89DRAFT_1145272 [Hymenopellis radicata]
MQYDDTKSGYQPPAPRLPRHDTALGDLRSQKIPPPYAVLGLHRDDAGHCYMVDISIEELADHTAAQPSDPSDSETTEDPLPETATPLHPSTHRDSSITTPTKPSAAPNASQKPKKPLPLLGFRLIEWNGRQDCRQSSMPTCVPRRTKECWDEVERELRTAFTEIMSHPKAILEDHRRGGYGAVGAGISLGTGSIAPGNLRLKSWEMPVVEKLHKLPVLKRVVGFVNCAFEGALPKLY